MTTVADFGRVAVLFGGTSAEREISLMSGRAVLDALLRQGVDARAFDPAERPLSELAAHDRAFIVLHGRHGEDGAMQGVLELMGIPYTGSGVMASALAMDKWRTKMVWQAAGIPTPGYALLDEHADLDDVVERLGLPLFVKPATEGSSIGVTKVKQRGELETAWRAAAEHDPLVLAESFIAGREVQFSVLGTQVLPSVRIETPCEFYDYQAKYFRDDTHYLCPGLPADEERALQQQVLRAFQVLGCRGWGRVDLMLANDGTPWFLEMNTVPGMTDHSLVPMAARAAGITFDQLVWRILESTLSIAAEVKHDN